MRRCSLEVFSCGGLDFNEALWTTVLILKAPAQANLGNFQWTSREETVCEAAPVNKLLGGQAYRGIKALKLPLF